MDRTYMYAVGGGLLVLLLPAVLSPARKVDLFYSTLLYSTLHVHVVS